MSKILRAVAQARNVALDMAYMRRPLRDLHAVRPTEYSVSAAHSCDYQLINDWLGKFPIRPDDVFVDIGCGYGRVLMMAARSQSSARIVGVEGESHAAERARRVQSKYPNVEVIEGWAPAAIPRDVTYAFMYNPFPGEVAAQVLEAVRNGSAGERCRVLMLNQRDEETVLSSDVAREYFVVRREMVGGRGLLKGITMPLLEFSSAKNVRSK